MAIPQYTLQPRLLNVVCQFLSASSLAFYFSLEYQHFATCSGHSSRAGLLLIPEYAVLLDSSETLLMMLLASELLILP